MLYILLAFGGVIAGFSIASLLWYYSVVKKDDPVGDLIEYRTNENGVPEYYIAWNSENDILRARTMKYVKLAVTPVRYKAKEGRTQMKGETNNGH